MIRTAGLLICLLSGFGMNLNLLGQPEPAPGPLENEAITRLYEIRWANIQQIYGIVVSILGSQPSNTQILPGQPVGLIKVTAAPGQQELIQNLIDKYDVRPQSILLKVYLLRATRDGQGIADDVPQEVRPILDDVASVMMYQHFTLQDVVLLRTDEGSSAGSSGSSGHIGVRGVKVVHDEGGAQIQVDQFQALFRENSTPPSGGDTEARPREFGSLPTSFSLGGGEMIVLGASNVAAADDRSGQPGRAAAEAVVTIVKASIIH